MLKVNRLFYYQLSAYNSEVKEALGVPARRRLLLPPKKLEYRSAFAY